MRNLRSGSTVEKTYNNGFRVTDVRLDKAEVQYLYNDGELYHFMNTETYEQIQLHQDSLEDVIPYIKESDICSLLMLEGKPLTVEPPLTVELLVTQSDPGVRGDTAQGGSKPATMETGLVVQVPLFIEEGEVLKIDSRTGKYLGRV